MKSLNDHESAGSPNTRPRITIHSAFNLLFKQWDTVFPNASCAVALVDRLTHHAEIIPIEGESYRKREADLTQKKRRGSP